MVNSGDKSVWPDPVSPCCILTVSQGIAATVAVHQSQRDRNRETGNKGRKKKGGWKEGVSEGKQLQLRKIHKHCFFFSLMESKLKRSISISLFLCNVENVELAVKQICWDLVYYKYELLTDEREELWLLQSQLVSGRGGLNEALCKHDAGVTQWSPAPNCGPGKLL